MNAKKLICVAFYGLINLVLSQHTIRIGGIFDYNQEEAKRVFELAHRIANERILRNYNYELMPDSQDVQPGNENQVSTALCSCLRNAVSAVFGPETEISAYHARYICDVKEMPYIETRWEAEPKLSVINMHPAQDSLSQMLADVITSSSWESFTILYESPMWLARANQLLEFYDPKEHQFTIRQLDGGNEDNKNYRPILQLVKQSKESNIILECSTENLKEILDQMLQVSLLSESQHLIITNLDLLTIDMEKYRFTGANITGFQLINSEKLKELRKNEVYSSSDSSNSESMLLHTALIYDGVILFAEAIRNLSVAQLDAKELECDNSDLSWKNGYTIANNIKHTVIEGLTGEVRFDEQGLRSYINVEIFELKSYGEETIAKWNPKDGLILIRKGVQRNELEDGPISEKTFRVVSSLNEPYCMIKDSAGQLTGNDQYEGYAIDLIEEVSKLLHFKYVIQIYDGGYGIEVNNATGAWDGMIGMILNNSADLAVTDLAMTSERAAVLDFTTSFMSLGIALLYRKPTKSPPSTFSFMDPFSTQVWICLGCSYIAVSLCYFFLGRISPFEWDNPYPCIEEPTELDNQFTITNSMWFAIGALLQQGSEMAPRSASTRITSSVWWFFTLIIVSSYTANLAAFLVNENAVPLIESVHDLKGCYKNENCPVQFGAKKDGATFNFFANSEAEDFKEIGQYLKDHVDEMPMNPKEGIEKVDKREDYAFLMESSSIEYMIERKCNLTQVGELLDDKNYGIGMRQHYVYYDDLSEAILILQETGKLAQLKDKWWKEKDGGGSCTVVEPDAAVPLGLGNVIGVFYTLIIGGFISVLFSISDVLWETRRRCKIHKVKENPEADPLGMKNTRGIFLVLLFGGIIATLYGIFELILLTYRRSKKYKLSFKTELWKEIVFLFTSQGNTKPVLHRNSPSTSSPYSGSSYRSNKSRYSPMVQMSVHHYK